MKEKYPVFNCIRFDEGLLILYLLLVSLEVLQSRLSGSTLLQHAGKTNYIDKFCNLDKK